VNDSTNLLREIEIIISLYEGRDYSGVVLLTKKLIKTYPEEQFLWKALGTALREEKSLEDALYALKKAVEIFYADAELHNSIGTILRDQHRLVEAETYFKAAIAIKPDYAEAIFNHGNTLFELNKHNEAEICYKQVIHTNPLYAAVHNNLGIIYRNREQLSDAEICFREAIKIKPDYADAHFNLGSIFIASRRLDEAEMCFREAIKNKEDYAMAYDSLGAVLNSFKNYQEAEQNFRQAVRLSPKFARAHFNLGCILESTTRLDEAVISYKKAIEHDPNFSTAYLNLGNAITSKGQLCQAEACYREAIRINPDYTDAYFNLGSILTTLERLDEAEVCYKTAIKKSPEYIAAHNNLGTVLHALGRYDEAIASFNTALHINPDYAEAYCNYGNALTAKEQRIDAERAYRKAIQINPKLEHAHNNLANILILMGRLDEAEESCRNALKINANFAEAYSNLGNVLGELGSLDEALFCWQNAIRIKPMDILTYSYMLFPVNYHPTKTSAEIFSFYQEFDKKFGSIYLKEPQKHTNSKNKDKHLKIGYVSADFKKHAIQNFLQPLLENHDKRKFIIYAYTGSSIEDSVTAVYKKYIDNWVPAYGLSDEALSNRIRSDEIDVLVDLSGHSNGNRLGVFARKPAPVSITYLGYGSTTGLSAIDYFLTDIYQSPLGSEAFFAEKLWRVNSPCAVYRPSEDMGSISVSPVRRNGYVTFGALTRAIRLNDRVIKTWSEILRRVKNSKLIVNSHNFSSAYPQQLLLSKFSAHGISPNQLEIGYQSPAWIVLQDIDIGLDSFPHNSGTTLYESLYMGVPFVTLASRPSVGRIGSMVLEGLGHPEWIVNTEEEYINKVVNLASDLPALAGIRTKLREKMAASPLMDEVGYARKVEATYYEMFIKWCESKS
jgi:predicted O-linked N-acetylglucosamine transferase (SPINDLY family)